MSATNQWTVAERAVFGTLAARTGAVEGSSAFLDSPPADAINPSTKELQPLVNYWSLDTGLGGGDGELYEAGCFASHTAPSEIFGIYKERSQCQALWGEVAGMLADNDNFNSHTDLQSFRVTASPVLIRDDQRGGYYTITIQCELNYGL